MAKFFGNGLLVNADKIAVDKVIPAEGPSFGIAPSGRWT